MQDIRGSIKISKPLHLQLKREAAKRKSKIRVLVESALKVAYFTKPFDELPRELWFKDRSANRNHKNGKR